MNTRKIFLAALLSASVLGGVAQTAQAGYLVTGTITATILNGDDSANIFGLHGASMSGQTMVLNYRYDTDLMSSSTAAGSASYSYTGTTTGIITASLTINGITLTTDGYPVVPGLRQQIDRTAKLRFQRQCHRYDPDDSALRSARGRRRHVYQRRVRLRHRELHQPYRNRHLHPVARTGVDSRDGHQLAGTRLDPPSSRQTTGLTPAFPPASHSKRAQVRPLLLSQSPNGWKPIDPGV